MLRSVRRHRFLTAEHVHQLHFNGTSVRVAQVRLQRLWAARFLDRLYLPPEQPNVRDRWNQRPLYSLATRGAEVVAQQESLRLADIAHTPAQNRQGFGRMRHNLVATELLVAIEAYCTSTQPWACTTAREDLLAARLYEARKRRKWPQAILPDGAVTLSLPSVAMQQTVLIEIVRAGVKTGNDAIRRRMLRIRAALRDGFFREAYGFEWIRSVVFLTPTMRRAEHLARLARDVPGAERLFRFGAYQEARGRKAPMPIFTPLTVPDALLLTPSGARVPILPPISLTTSSQPPL